MRFLGKPLIGPSGAPMPISPAVEINGLVYLSGQLAFRDGKLVEGNATAQAETIFDELEMALVRAGLTLDNIFKATVWIADPADFAAFNAVYGTRLRAPYPVRSCVVSSLVILGARIEMEVVASREHRRA